MKKSHAFITAGLSAIAGAVSFGGGVAHADPTTVWSGATETREEDRRFHVNGRFQYDVASTDADCANVTCTGVNESGIRSYARRAFLGVDGRLTTNWRYNVKFDFNLANNGGASVRADDLYLEYAGQDWSFIVGNNNAVSPMEDRDSSLNIPFNERSFLISASGVGKRPGIAWITNGGNWSLGANLSSNDTLDTTDTASNGTESYFFGGRATWAPIFEQTPDGTTVLHLGLYARYRNNGDGNANTLNGLFTYSPNALSNKSNNNASVGGADSDTFFDGEMAFQWNSFGIDGEYGQIKAHDSALTAAELGDGTAKGYYFDVFWSPTGESRRYNAADGSFGAIAPRRTLGSDGGIGHIMLSARYESFDTSDGGFAVRPASASAADIAAANAADRRAETTAYTLGATWVPVQHVKFQLNYSQTDISYTNRGDISTTAGLQQLQDNSIKAVVLRTQFDW
ncbi:MAG: porin [Terricaulis sp.]